MDEACCESRKYGGVFGTDLNGEYLVMAAFWAAAFIWGKVYDVLTINIKKIGNWIS